MADHDPPQSNDAVEDEDNTNTNTNTNTSSASTSSASFLGELNLVMLVAFLTLSPDDLDDPDNSVATSIAEDHHARCLRNNPHSDAFKAADRRSASRSQPKIVDSRHGRKM